MIKKLALILLIILPLRSYGEGFFQGLGGTFTDAFDKDGLIILGVSAAATAFAFSQDQAMHDTWSNHQRMSADVSRIGDYWGRGYAEGAIVGAQLIWDKDNGVSHLQGLIASTAVVYALKFSTARFRPDTDTRDSFPSGHTQFSFATATSLAMSYGWKAAIPAYGMAVFTGLSRLSDNAHWFSDVVAGAAIGILFARAAHKHQMMVLPVTFSSPGERGYGLELTYHF